MPIALAGLGGLWSERAGVVNIGLEGMMILGTWGAATSATTTAPGPACSARSLFGVLGGALHALATVIFGVDHIVSGVAINIIAARRRRRSSPRRGSPACQGGGPTQSPPLDRRRRRSPCPASPTALSTLEDKHWFLVSDLAARARSADHEPVAR